MYTDRTLEWENRYIEATGRFPPGRDIPAAMGNDPGCRATSEELAWWIVCQQQTEIDKLPKTADGVPVVPSVDCVYVIADQVILRVRATCLHLGRNIDKCYSTREAAEAAEGSA